jgi:hypothetical protein
MDKVKRSIAEYWQGSKAYAVLLAREARGLSNFVPQGVADGRAMICKDCPFNLPPGKAEKIADGIILRRTGNRRSLLDPELQNCDACSCPLKLAIHLEDEVLRKTKDPRKLRSRMKTRQAATGKKIPSNCWQAKLFNIKP